MSEHPDNQFNIGRDLNMQGDITHGDKAEGNQYKAGRDLHVHQAAKPETPWQLPARDTYFIGRAALLTQLKALLQQGVTAARQLEKRYDEGAHLGNLGLAYSHLGQVEEAIAHYQHVITIFDEIKSPHAATVRPWLEEPQTQQ